MRIATFVTATLTLISTIGSLHAADATSAKPAALPRGVVENNGHYVAQADGMELIFVPGGVFTMGCDDGHYSERPPHKVKLYPYLMDKHEVTNAQFAKFVRESGYKTEGPWLRGYQKTDQGEFPVRFVTWNDANAYAQWAGRVLPTEAQWELAARGTQGLQYPWGAKWEDNRARTNQPVSAGPTKVGSFPQGDSPYGCQDMAGNVWEWCNDWYDRFYYQNFKDADMAVNPTGPYDGALPEKRFIFTNTASGNERSTRKVIRGGGWVQGEENCRTSKRSVGNPHYWFPDTGFRCAVWVRRTRTKK